MQRVALSFVTPIFRIGVLVIFLVYLVQNVCQSHHRVKVSINNITTHNRVVGYLNLILISPYNYSVTNK